MYDFSVSRRSVLKGSVAAASLASGGLQALAQSGPNWKKFSGTSLEVNLIKGPRAELLQKFEKEFTELTGIKVSSEQIPEQQQRQKAVIELSSGKPSFDVVHLSYAVQKRQFEKGGWLADLSGFMKDASLTPVDLKQSEFSAAGLAYAMNERGEMRSLPISVDYWCVYWNKELFAKKKLSFPTTFDEFLSAAEALTDPREGVYGIVGRGQRNANVPVWTNFLLGYGGAFLDEKKNILIDSPEAIEAAKFYQRLLTKAAPPGIAGFNWSECQSAFMQGKVGMWSDGIGFAPALEDPTKSRVVGKVGYGVVPRGPKDHASGTFGDGIGVTQASSKKEAAYLYCAWAVSPQMQSRLIQSGGGVPCRTAVMSDPETLKGVTLPTEWSKAVVDSSKISKLGLPIIIPVTEYRDIVGTALTATLSGADPAAELRKAAEQFKPILERSEKS